MKAARMVQLSKEDIVVDCEEALKGLYGGVARAGTTLRLTLDAIEGTRRAQQRIEGPTPTAATRRNTGEGE